MSERTQVAALAAVVFVAGLASGASILYGLLGGPGPILLFACLGAAGGAGGIIVAMAGFKSFAHFGLLWAFTGLFCAGAFAGHAVALFEGWTSAATAEGPLTSIVEILGAFAYAMTFNMAALVGNIWQLTTDENEPDV